MKASNQARLVAELTDLAWAPAPPPEVRIEGALSDDTSLSWAVSPGAAGFVSPTLFAAAPPVR